MRHQNNTTEIQVLRKIYKGQKLKFRRECWMPSYYRAYDENGQRVEEHNEGWGWRVVGFFLSQLEELPDW